MLGDRPRKDLQKNLRIDTEEGRLIHMAEDLTLMIRMTEIHMITTAKGLQREVIQKEDLQKGDLLKEDPQKEVLRKEDLRTEAPKKEDTQREDLLKEDPLKEDTRIEYLQREDHLKEMTDMGGQNQKRKFLTMVGGAQLNHFKL